MRDARGGIYLIILD